MKTESRQGSPTDQILWLVERQEFSELLTFVIDHKLPSVTSRRFERPEIALQALKESPEVPDVLITAFYFDGDFRNGLWLVQQARKTYPNLRTVVTSGYPSDHVRGVAWDLEARPDLLLWKGGNVLSDWMPALETLLFQPRKDGRNATELNPVQVALDPLPLKNRVTAMRRPRRAKGKPLVYLVGPSQSRKALEAYAEQVKPSGFGKGENYQYFECPELARASMQEGPRKPDGLVVDYYLDGGYLNGLKLIRDAQTAVPGIGTVLVSWFSKHHLRGIIEGTGISPDFVFHCESYRLFNLALRGPRGMSQPLAGAAQCPTIL